MTDWDRFCLVEYARLSSAEERKSMEETEDDDVMDSDMAMTSASPIVSNTNTLLSGPDDVELVTFDSNGIITFVNPLFSDMTENSSENVSLESHIRTYQGEVVEPIYIFDPWQPITVEYTVGETTDEMVEELKKDSNILKLNIPSLLLPFCE